MKTCALFNSTNLHYSPHVTAMQHLDSLIYINEFILSFQIGAVLQKGFMLHLEVKDVVVLKVK
jgi:hypothetical protein